MITIDTHIKDVNYEKYKPVFGQFIPIDVFVHLTIVFSDMNATYHYRQNCSGAQPSF